MRLAAITTLALTERADEAIISHAERKLRGAYLAGESPERKAFGLLAGRLCGERGRAEVTTVFPLARNARHDSAMRDAVNAVLAALAIPSETPLAHRGWIADSGELISIYRQCDADGLTLLGAYHTHRVPWPDDPLRDTCTAVDEQLARGVGLWVVIVSVVDAQRPIIRAFFDGDNEREAVVERAVRPQQPTPNASDQPRHRSAGGPTRGRR